MRNPVRRKRLRESGQAMVEFALVLPILLLLVVGMLEFARAWNLHQVMTDAVREGARRAVLGDDLSGNCPSTSTALVDSVKAPMWRYLAQFGYDPSLSNLGTNSPNPLVNPGDFKCSGRNITVTLTLPYRFFVLSNKAITMKSTFTMRNE